MKRWRTVLWAALLVLPGGFWILGAVAVVNAVRRRWPVATPALPPAGPSDEAGAFVPGQAPQPGNAAVSTWF